MAMSEPAALRAAFAALTEPRQLLQADSTKRSLERIRPFFDASLAD